MGKIIFILAVAVGTFAYFKHQDNEKFKRELSYQRALASGNDQCSGKKFCAVIYMAPWCPACHRIAPDVQEFVKNMPKAPDYGLKVIVGMGRQAGDNEKMAKDFGAHGLVDNDLNEKNRLGVRYYPTLFVFDKEGTEILKDQEAFGWMKQKLQ